MIRNKPTEFIFGIVAIIAIAIFFLFNSFLSEGSLYGGDSYAHYLIARYAFAHPTNFLDHWGKPLFTLLAAPFAYFGFHGIMVFNILVCMLSSYLTLLVARKLGYANGVLTIAFTSFAPIFILLMFSGLTEAFFALMLIATAYFYITNKFLLTAVLISFIPFVRSEGMMFVIWFMVLLIIKRQYKALPFVFSGVLFYSLLGGLIKGDYLWLIHDNPYGLKSDIYGHGSLFEYVNSVPATFGYLMFYLALLGFLAIIISFLVSFFRKKAIANSWFNEFFVIGCSAFGYFVFHSVVWWKGWLSVLGDPRFMAAIVPLMAILALKGFNVLVIPIKRQWVIWSLMVVISGVMVFKGLDRHRLPVKLIMEERTINSVMDWVKENHYDQHQLIYNNVVIPVLLDKDPFDQTRMRNNLEDSQCPEKGVAPGTVMIWDGHFSAQEGQLPLQRMLDNPNYQLLKLVEADPPFKAVGDENYKVAVFIRK
jgi:hypothetical protein